MKKLLAIVSMMSLASLATQQQYVPTDNSVETQLCIAATKSEVELKRKARLLNVDTYELSTIACNKTPLNKFPSKYKKIKSIL